MASHRPSEKQALAADAWRRLFDVFMSTRWQRDQVLKRLSLTPNDSKALWTLDPAKGKPMRALADAWGTDASNATWVVDRLERRGLAERRTPARDRRVKLVVLTARGAKTRERILRAFHEPPPGLLTLDRRDLRALGEILAKLGTTVRAERPSTLGPVPVATGRAPASPGGASGAARARSGRATKARRSRRGTDRG